MIGRRPPMAISGLVFAVLDGIEPSEYSESLETSLSIASLSSPDLRKQIAQLRTTLRIDSFLSHPLSRTNGGHGRRENLRLTSSRNE
jgi:hypothetical protein